MTPLEDAKRELLKRVGRYRHAPTLAALRHRMKRYCGGDEEVEQVVRDLMRESRLRCTNKVFHLPTFWDEFFGDLG